MEARLDVRLLGSFSLALDGRPIEALATPRLQALLAYLLLNAGAPQPRSQLSFAFWPDAAESNARNNLRQLLHQLRQALPDAGRWLRVDASSVQWDPASSFSLDVGRFEQALAEAERARRDADATARRTALERAVEVCQGPLLPSCYDDWIGPFRERQERRCEEAAAALAAVLEEEREYPEAIARVGHWLRHDPVDEEAYRTLMRLHALAGDRAAALQAYRRCAEVLERELGAVPTAETVRVYERIRDTEPGAARARGRETPAASPSLVGRRAEWEKLRAAWLEAARGRASFALVTGDAGIGKSRLAEELIGWTRSQGIAAAHTRCYAAEGRLSLAPVAEWLRGDALFPHLARLDAVWRVEVSRILPELSSARAGTARPEPMTGFGDRLRFFEALARGVLAAPPPLLLVVDDLQWCDRETIEWLHFLSRFDASARLLVVATARPEEIDEAHPVSDLLRHLRADARVSEIALEPLDAAETAKLASEIANRGFDADAATRLYHQTEGNPLFVVETVRAEAGDAPDPAAPLSAPPGLPPRAQAVIAGRLARLSEQARDTAAVAAVIGRAFDHAVLVRLGDEDATVRALDELWRKRIVREHGPNAYDFTHDKLREAAYGLTSAPQRRLLHRRVAEALAAVHEKDLDPVSARIAAHYESAALPEDAIPFYARAATVARAVYAHDDALALAARGLSLLQGLRPGARRDAWELELQLAITPSYRITRGWSAPELGAVLDRALALCDRVGTFAQRAEILYGLQSFYIVAGRLEKSALVTDEMARVFRDALGAEPHRAAFAMMAGVRVQMGRFREACDEIDSLLHDADPGQLQRLQESQGLNYEVISRAWQSHGLWCLGRPDTALDRGRRALEIARDLGQPFSEAIAATYLALLQQLRAGPGEFRAQAEEALQLATRFKASYYRAWAAILVAYAEAAERPEAGIVRLRDAIDSFRDTGARLRLPYYLALLADVHLRAGQAEAGLEVIEEGLRCGRETNERWWDAELHRLRGALLQAAGADVSETAAALGRALEIARGQQARSFELRAASSLASLWARGPRREEGRGLLETVYRGFDEGLETPDLVRARELLAGLTRTP
jgi:DNA-binding SARP family transcriptional activator